jgi:hypothetical protein
MKARRAGAWARVEEARQLMMKDTVYNLRSY